MTAVDSSKAFSEMTPDELKAAGEYASGQIRANRDAWKEARKSKNSAKMHEAIREQMAWVSVINQIGDELVRRTKIDRSNIADLKALTDGLPSLQL
jgi:hypothetical protein